MRGSVSVLGRITRICLAVSLICGAVGPAMAVEEGTYRKVGDKFVLIENGTKAESTPCLEYRTRGDTDAKLKHNSGVWTVMGFVGGLLGAIPGALVWAIGTNSTPAAPLYLLPEDPALSRCYEQGYVERAKSNNSDSAMIGCIGGLGVLIILLAASNSG